MCLCMCGRVIKEPHIKILSLFVVCIYLEVIADEVSDLISCCRYWLMVYLLCVYFFFRENDVVG